MCILRYHWTHCLEIAATIITGEWLGCVLPYGQVEGEALALGT